jgi:hypothetical protein
MNQEGRLANIYGKPGIHSWIEATLYTIHQGWLTSP